MVKEQPTQNLQMIVIVNHKIYLSRSQTFPDQSAIDKPARLIIRLLFGFASDSVFDKLNQYTNTETAMLSSRPFQFSDHGYWIGLFQ